MDKQVNVAIENAFAQQDTNKKLVQTNPELWHQEHLSRGISDNLLCSICNDKFNYEDEVANLDDYCCADCQGQAVYYLRKDHQ